MLHALIDLHREQSGQDLIEYALTAMIVSLGALAGMGQLASSLDHGFHHIAEKLHDPD